MLLVTRGSSQYYLTFESNSQLVGWCSDIQDVSSSGFPEEPFPTSPEDLGESLVDEIIEDYSVRRFTFSRYLRRVTGGV